jgi:TRAP-type C4-dicarboxylate transport system permease small subunit
MTIAAAIFLIAIGAILRYAFNLNVQDVDLDTVGLILMIAGAIGLLLSFLQEAMWSNRRDRRVAESEDAAAARERERAAADRRDPPPRY